MVTHASGGTERGSDAELFQRKCAAPNKNISFGRALTKFPLLNAETAGLNGPEPHEAGGKYLVRKL